MTRTIFCQFHAESVCVRGRHGAYSPAAALWREDSRLSLVSSRGLVRRSLQSQRWEACASLDVARKSPIRVGAPLRPNTAGSPSLSSSKHAYSTVNASRPEERRFGLRGAVSCRTDGNSFCFGDADCDEPRPQEGVGGFPSASALFWGVEDWKDSDVRVVAEKNGQATVATDSSPRLRRTLSRVIGVVAESGRILHSPFPSCLSR